MQVSFGIPMTHVPYKGIAPATTDFLAGRLDVLQLSVPTSLPLLKAGKIKAIGVTGRKRSALLPDMPTIDEAGLLGYARAIISWRRRHRFCGTCGAKTMSAKSGHVLVCSNPSCRHEQFPRIDPAIIVLVSDAERALLGRQAAWPVGRYSTIAGFVEPGESLEDAVAREVFEETGIEVDRIEYHSSQPWPFPASLMLGFTAHAVTTEVHLRDQELEDARWFTRADLASNGTLLPPRQSISYRLIEHWFDAGSDARLRDIQGSAPWPQSR